MSMHEYKLVNPRVYEFMKTAGYASPELAPRGQMLAKLIVEDILKIMQRAIINDVPAVDIWLKINRIYDEKRTR